MSSIFVRPDSPPPRQPSPDFLPAPLPYPHHPRRIASQPKIRVHSPAIPPGLHGRTKTLQSARSCDFLSSRLSESRTTDADSASLSLRTETRGARARSPPNLTVSQPPSQSQSPSQSSQSTPSSSPSPDFVPRHRRTLSVAFSAQSSRSTTPDHHPQVPPVPLVPYRYTGPQHIVCPKPLSLNKPILLESRPRRDSDVQEIRLQVPSTPSPPLEEDQKSTSDNDNDSVLPPLEKHKSMGMACLKFFGMSRSPSRQTPRRTAVTAM